MNTNIPLRRWNAVRSQLRYRIVAYFVAWCAYGAMAGQISKNPENVRRAVTVADTIEMTRIAGRGALSEYGGSLEKDFAIFSPNGKRFLLVTKTGILEPNVNEYRLLLFEVEGVVDHSSYKILATLRSSSNKEGITDVTWAEDNDLVLFLGQKPGEPTRLYSVRCSTGEIEKLTRQPTDIVSFSASRDTRQIAYVVEKPVTNLINAQTLKNGFYPSTEMLSDLIEGHEGDRTENTDLYVMEVGGRAPKKVSVSHRLDSRPVYISPDGKSLIVVTNSTEKPLEWASYKDSSGILQNIYKRKVEKGAVTWMLRYELVDLESGQSRVAVNAPISYKGSEVVWMRDSRSFLLTGVYLPLDLDDPKERSMREATALPIEVKVSDLEITKLANRDLEFRGWDRAGEVLKFSERSTGTNSQNLPVEFYSQTDGRWASVQPSVIREPEVEIELSQGLNSPPKVVARLGKNDGQTTILDLNPQFKNLRFGHVEVVRWKDSSGHEIEAGLYLPPNYIPGRRYPLVIQTHGFEPTLFFVDGPFSTAFAAQSLASKDIVVLQLPGDNDWKRMGTVEEGPNAMDIIERAIDFLDRKGIIVRERVGIIGFSHTCFHVEYTLTHSHYDFAAAVIADGMDTGYFQYVTWANVSSFIRSFVEDTNAGIPFGKGLASWVGRTPGFLLDKVNAPIRIQAIGPGSLLEEWEWFAGLKALNKPEEMVYIPTGAHILQKPWDRMISQQGDVDWFDFWLNNREDSDPAKAEQYRRWRDLRKLQEQSQGKAPTN